MLTTTIDRLVAGGDIDLGTSRWIGIDQQRIDAFADVTEDRQWIHTDPERAQSGPFGVTIAQGYLTLSLVSSFLLDLIEVTDAGSLVNYGLDRVRFPAPVPAGARVRGHGEMLVAKEIDGGVQTTTRITVECDAAQKPVAVAEVVTRFLRR